MSLPTKVAAVTSRINYAAIYLQRSDHRCELAAASVETLVGVKVTLLAYAI
jgi:hypothetical protein